MYQFSLSPTLWGSYKYSNKYWAFSIADLCWQIWPVISNLSCQNPAQHCSTSPAKILWEFISFHSAISIFQDCLTIFTWAEELRLQLTVLHLLEKGCGQLIPLCETILHVLGQPKPKSDHAVIHQNLLWIMMIKSCWQLAISS